MNKVKPYQFVPLNREVDGYRERVRDRSLLDKKLYHGKLILRGKTLTSLLVLSGQLTLQKGQVVKGLVTNQGCPILPGSSLKGVVRSVYESVSYSCIKQPNIKHIDSKKYLPQANQNPCSGRSVCTTCQVFGYVGDKTNVAKSLVNFNDFKLEGEPEEWVSVEKIPDLYEPLREAKALVKYLDNDEFFQRKFYSHGIPQTHKGKQYQIIKAGATFTGGIYFQNLNDVELGRLAFSFGVGKLPFAIKVGYAKPAFFGSIQFELAQVQPYKIFGYQAKSLTKEDIYRLSGSFAQGDEFNQEQQEKIAKIFNYETNKGQTWQRDKNGNKGY